MSPSPHPLLPSQPPPAPGPQIFSDIVFAEKNFVDANFSKEGFEYYLRLRAQMLALLPAPHVVLYLDVSPAECHHRIHRLRKRVCAPRVRSRVCAAVCAVFAPPYAPCLRRRMRRVCAAVCAVRAPPCVQCALAPCRHVGVCSARMCLQRVQPQ